METLSNFSLVHPFFYLFAALALSFVVRIFIALAESICCGSFKKMFLAVLGGCGKNNAPKDNWLCFILGCMEATTYPILLVVDKPEYIGVWLAFKTVNRYKYKEMDRGFFNRYLVANGMILIGSYFLAQRFVTKCAT